MFFFSIPFLGINRNRFRFCRHEHYIVWGTHYEKEYKLQVFKRWKEPGSLNHYLVESLFIRNSPFGPSAVGSHYSIWVCLAAGISYLVYSAQFVLPPRCYFSSLFWSLSLMLKSFSQMSGYTWLSVLM